VHDGFASVGLTKKGFVFLKFFCARARVRSGIPPPEGGQNMNHVKQE